MLRVFLSLALFALSASAQNTIPVTVVVNGVTYSGNLTAQTPEQAPQTKETAPPATNTHATEKPANGKPHLPKQMMTAEYALNQSIANVPPDTRRLLQDDLKPGNTAEINEKFHSGVQFGNNTHPVHLGFGPWIPITLVDTRLTPNIFEAVKLTTNWTNKDASHVPVKSCKIEGGNSSPSTSDRHCLIYDAATGIDHELFNVNVDAAGHYSAQAYTPWDMNQPQQGKLGEDSADAAGLPVLPLLLRYQEVANGAINHAIRFTLPHSRGNQNGGYFVAPASHAAADNWSVFAWMGMRLRLRPDFPTTGLSKIDQTIVRALKTYGLVLADNGGPYIICDDDPRWDEGDLKILSNAMALSDFIAVNTGNIVDSEGNVAK